MTKVMAVTLLVSSLVVPLLGACARPAPASAPAPAPATAPATATKADTLAQIIEGANKEGAAIVRLTPSLLIPGIEQDLARAIKDKYGVNLKITAARGGVQAQDLAQRIMEHQTGAPATYDVIGFASTYVPEAIKSGAFEIVDWRPLIEKDLHLDYTPQGPTVRGALLYKDAAIGLVYNPEKISKAEAPKTLSELTDPKWKGRIGLAENPARWVEWAFVLGKDTVFSYLRSLVKMKPVIASFSGVDQRFLIGEIDLYWGLNSYIGQNRSKGVPTAFQSLDFIYKNYQHLVVPKGAPHANAGKLVGIYLVSMDGQQYQTKIVNGHGMRFTPGNIDYDSYQEDLKRGLPQYDFMTFPGMIEFMVSPEFDKWEKEIGLILKGAG